MNASHHFVMHDMMDAYVNERRYSHTNKTCKIEEVKRLKVESMA